MKNTFGQSVAVTLFGESHGNSIGAVLDGIAPGIPVDIEFIKSRLSLRRPSGNISTPRVEADEFQILSGVYEGKTTGTPICITIPNTNTKGKHYDRTEYLARPGHADYSAYMKYHGFEDRHGGGHFSGRVTAALVAVGAIAQTALINKGINLGTHIKCIGGIYDRNFENINRDIKALRDKQFAVLDDSVSNEMTEKINAARCELNSVGGILETAVTGVPAGVGEPWFDSVESRLSHALFSIPAVKGVQFGAGFGFADMFGSDANDEYYYEGGTVKTLTNNNGGIIGGITNGSPIIFSCVVKPTPSIARAQKTVNYKTGENAEIKIEGRHDPCIVHRARAVVDAVSALTLCDILSMRFGTDWLGA